MRLNYWRIVLLLFIVLICVLGIFFVWQKYIVKPLESPFAGYQAVFLDNGQVYFGKIVSIQGGYIDLSQVYYVASNSNGSPSQSSAQGSAGSGGAATISLVKLGNELHGPTDEMFIAEPHVLFYENLRPDSQVVQSIATTTTQ